jgi:hypothetical protein
VLKTPSLTMTFNTRRNDRGAEMLDLIRSKLEITPTVSSVSELLNSAA